MTEKVLIVKFSSFFLRNGRIFFQFPSKSYFLLFFLPNAKISSWKEIYFRVEALDDIYAIEQHFTHVKAVL